ncbi:unnamed protein product [Penicillium salamii]|uniref:Uncharacterized protein n=1 Tax=Penicillium salamii TaxID=1612424 RepID=A0A9W4NVA7_9EURO|nr:unnamed protein product [Penicillium salamii]
MTTDDRKCYFPSGAEAPNNVPCRSDTNTWCCGTSDLCLDNGLCLNAGHQPYVLSRGACTSQDWTGCTNHCSKSCVLNPLWSSTIMNDGPILTNCGATEDSTPTVGASISNIFFNGSTSLYCCGSPMAVGSSVVCPSTSDNDGTPFTVKSGRVIPGRALLQNVPTLKNTSSSASNTTNGTSTTCQTCHDTAIGAGVGVPLGALALLFVIWALLERRRASRLSRALDTPGPINRGPVQLSSENSELSGHTRKRNNMVELEGGRPELDSGVSARE